MRQLVLTSLLTLAAWCGLAAQTTYSGTEVAAEGAWCWFADPRALHYENADGNINATYIGYIDVHGNIKATQYDWIAQRKTDVLVRSYFQPDDHNNPTFLVLPDERVLIIYSRHTDEAAFYYRISRKPGDITSLGEEKRLATANNTTYPSPFILSDDPTHWYLCWRGIGWHPTIARLTMPDANDNVQFDFGPKQMVQSTGARPYAKYQSNGKDKIYMSYTTGHPDNEQPDWLYFNVIDINHGNGPILRDVNGKELKKVVDGVFNVNKTDSYANSYAATVIDRTASIRNWVWQIALDENEKPVVAYPHIDDAKTTHVYWYARWTGTEWRRTWVQYGGHAFHQNWNSTERCYSGGMAIDPDHVSDLYLSIPTIDGQYHKDGVYEIWKYTINEDGTVGVSEQMTRGSEKNNVRPFVLHGSKESPMRLLWMHGDYYYWMVRQGYEQGYPTGIRCDYDWQEALTPYPEEDITCTCLSEGRTLTAAFAMDANHYEGRLLTIGDADELVYSINATDQCPEITVGGKTYKSQNRLLTSDDWATQSTGTNGDNHPTKVDTWVLTMTYDDHVLTTYRNGFVDQVIDLEAFQGGVAEAGTHSVLHLSSVGAVCSPLTVQQEVAQVQAEIERHLGAAALQTLTLPAETHTDLVLPTTALGQTVTWTSDHEQIVTMDGTVSFPSVATTVVLTAHSGEATRQFEVLVHERDITKNLRYEQAEPLDMTANTASGFSTNRYGLAPEGLLTNLRSYTFLLTTRAKSLASAPRFYDFGSASGNSVFLRANPLSAGIKLNGGTTTMVNATSALQTGKDYHIAVTFDAATKTTRIFIDGVEDAFGTANQNEPYMLAQVAADTRNYIGRTQWWDTSYKNDNVDYAGTISQLRLYDVALTRQEICEVQGLTYEEAQLPTQLQNGDFEGAYSVLTSSGVSNDRAIHVPEGWTVSRANPDENDLTALKAGDPYYSNFFADKPAPSASSKQTYWIRQNWGTPTLTLSQVVRLSAGDYTLTMDLWKSGLGGDAMVSVQTEGGATVRSESLPNQTAWQRLSLDFASDGKASTTIQLAAIHNSAGSEKIIGFDNVVLTPHVNSGIATIASPASLAVAAYDLSGRRVSLSGPLPSGIYVIGGRKVMK